MGGLGAFVGFDVGGLVGLAVVGGDVGLAVVGGEVGLAVLEGGELGGLVGGLVGFCCFEEHIGKKRVYEMSYSYDSGAPHESGRVYTKRHMCVSKLLTLEGGDVAGGALQSSSQVDSASPKHEALSAQQYGD